MSTIFQTFKEIGYLTVPNFIDKGQVNSLRDIGESLLGKQNDFTLKPTSFLKDPILSSIIFNQNFIRVLDDLSQEYRFFLPNFTVRKSLYIGWHTDDEFVEVDKDELPGVLQCNIYLQDNTGKNGGGIDIFPGSHRLEKIKKKALIEENKIKERNFAAGPTWLQLGNIIVAALVVAALLYFGGGLYAVAHELQTGNVIQQRTQPYRSIP